jgi:hypothetical protein
VTDTRRRARIEIAVVVAILAAVVAYASYAVISGNRPAAAPPSVKTACSDWASTKSDITAQILTDAELRDRAKRIYDEVEASADKRYATELAAQEVLAAVTHGDRVSIGPAMKDLDVECAWVSTQP